MHARTQGIMIAVGLAAVGASADYFLKRASAAAQPHLTGSFAFGMLIYSTTALGWVHAMKRLDLGTIGTVYSVATVLLMVSIGLHFGERPTARQQVAILLAIMSLILAFGEPQG